MTTPHRLAAQGARAAQTPCVTGGGKVAFGARERYYRLRTLRARATATLLVISCYRDFVGIAPLRFR
jgi:hypothetical protein